MPFGRKRMIHPGVGISIFLFIATLVVFVLRPIYVRVNKAIREYEEKLKKVIAEKCVHCVNYSEDACEQDFKSHIEHIDLNGECYGYEKKK